MYHIFKKPCTREKKPKQYLHMLCLYRLLCACNKLKLMIFDTTLM